MTKWPILLLLISASASAKGQHIYAVEELGIRPKGDDFAPVLTANGFIMTSVREQPHIIAYTQAGSGKPMTDLYEVSIQNGVPGKPQPLGKTINTRMNDGPAAFTASGDTMMFTRNTSAGGSANASDRLGLFMATKIDGAWTEPVPFPYNSDAWSVMHACFSTDGSSIYFASDRPGGAGGTDLYECRKEGRHWSVPVNLGPLLNSSSNELFPATDKDDRLYFSSDRSGGLGQLDIYTAYMKDDQWTRPMALPAPLNSPGNEIGYALRPDGITGLFSSDRDGKGCIYGFTRGLAPFQDCAPQQQNSYCYQFEDEGSMDTDTLPLRYEWDLGDGTRIAGLHAAHCYAAPGTYTVSLNIVDTLTQGVYYNETSYALAIDDIPQAYINGPDTLSTGALTAFDTVHTRLPGFTAASLNWDMGDGQLEQVAEVLHRYAQAGTYTVRLDLIAAADASGDFEHHCVTREVQVMDGYMAASPDADRDAATYQKAEPFAFSLLPSDEHHLGKKDTKDVVFTVLLFTSKERIAQNDERLRPIQLYYPVTERFDGIKERFTYSVGASKTLQGIFGVYAKAKELNYTSTQVVGIPMDHEVQESELDSLPLEALSNSVLRVSAVLFLSGKSTFEPAFTITLDKVVTVMGKYPGLHLVIEAHTDDQGSSESNLILSQERAQSIEDYLTGHGIDPTKLDPIGFGEDRPVADNQTAKGRAMNRRVEFRLTVPDPRSTSQQ